MSKFKLSLVLMCLVTALLLAGCGAAAQTQATTSVPMRTDGKPIPLGATTMVGKSLQEIGVAAQVDAVNRQDFTNGAPQVLLVKSITRQDLPSLGLSCMVDWGVIEEPPYALVILKGNLVPTLNGKKLIHSGAGALNTGYMAYVYDVWAGSLAYAQYSYDAGQFKKALNDPSLPDPQTTSATNTVCPAYSQARTIHYGDVVGTPGPALSQTTAIVPSSNPAVTAVLPAPVGTIVAATTALPVTTDSTTNR